jgi:hypothetical protein
MADVMELIFCYPHPDSFYDVVVTTTPQTRYFGSLWSLAKSEQPGLGEHVGTARPIFIIACSFSLCTTSMFSHIFSSRKTCLASHLPPSCVAAEPGFGSTVMMTRCSSSSAAVLGSTVPSLLCLLMTRCMSLSSPTIVRPSL